MSGSTLLSDRVAVRDEERDRMRVPPLGSPLMRQTWLDLVFLHYPLEPEIVQKVLPKGLTVDVFPDDSGRSMAWIGLVAFRIENIRLGALPAMPFLSSFNEVNVRTYAHLDGRKPSVVFLSLDGGPLPTRFAARAWYKAPYFKAKVTHSREGTSLRYTSTRPSGSGFSLACRLGPLRGEAEEQSFERFLTDRYQLFSANGTNTFSARVSHAPYRIGSVDSFECETDLPLAAGLPLGPFVHACWCDRVEASFYPPERVA